MRERESGLSRLAAEMRSPVNARLVDDNPMVPAMLRDARVPLAKVAPADGTGALLKAFHDLPDVLGSDLRTPDTDGRQLDGKPKGRERPSGLAVILVATRAGRGPGGDRGEEEDVLLDS